MLCDFGWPERFLNYQTAIEHNPSWTTDTSSVLQEILHVLWILKVRFRVQPVFLILSLINPIHRLKFCVCGMQFNVILWYTRRSFRWRVLALTPLMHYSSLRCMLHSLPIRLFLFEYVSVMKRIKAWRYNNTQLGKELGAEFTGSMQLDAFKRIVGSLWNSKILMLFHEVFVEDPAARGVCRVSLVKVYRPGLPILSCDARCLGKISCAFGQHVDCWTEWIFIRVTIGIRLAVIFFYTRCIIKCADNVI